MKDKVNIKNINTKSINTNSTNTDSSIHDDDSSINKFVEENSSDQEDEIYIDPITFFTVKEKCYYRTINKFFSNTSDVKIEKMITIVKGKSIISLRVLDWFVTKYSRKRIDCSGGNKDVDMFDVRISYKAQLKSYKKRYFDPFRRKKKFIYYFHNGLFVKTTIGQLNFFKWAFYYGIIEYVEKNLKQINKEIKTINKTLEDKKKKEKEIKELNKSSELYKKNKNGDSSIKKNNDKQLTVAFD